MQLTLIWSGVCKLVGSGLPASLDPVRDEENQQSSKASGPCRVRSEQSRWDRGPQKLLLEKLPFTSVVLSQSVVCRVAFLHGTLCPDGEGRNFISSFPHLPFI